MAKKRIKWIDAVVKAPLNLRTAPSLEAQKLCIMGKGEHIKISKCDESCPIGWVKVRFMDLEGFAMFEWIEVVNN